MRKYGLNVVSLWPYCLGPHGPERSIEWAKKIGFNGIQVLPMKWWSYERKRQWEEDVISYEDAFVYGPFWKAVLRQLGLLKYPAPLLSDWAAFGQGGMPSFGRALQIRHAPDALSAVIEIHPELSVKPGDYMLLYNTGYRFCFDAFHARRKKRNGDQSIASWQKLLELLPEDAVSVIHAHATKSEARAFVIGQRTELDDILRFVGKRYRNAPVIVEVFPPLKLPKATSVYLYRFLSRTRSLMDA